MEKGQIALAAFAQIFIVTYESTPIYDWNIQFEEQEKCGMSDRIRSYIFFSQLLKEFVMQKTQGEAGWCIWDSAFHLKPAPRTAVMIWVNVDFY